MFVTALATRTNDLIDHQTYSWTCFPLSNAVLPFALSLRGGCYGRRLTLPLTNPSPSNASPRVLGSF